MTTADRVPLESWATQDDNVIPLPEDTPWTDERLHEADELLSGLVELERYRVTSFGADDEASLTNLADVIDDFVTKGSPHQVQHLTGALALAVRKLAAK